MTFATEIARTRSQRYALVRVSPARAFADDAWADEGGDVYSVDMPRRPHTVELNGAALTEVASLSGNGQWLWDETNELLKVRGANAPELGTYTYVAFYYLHLCSDNAAGVATYETPDDDTTDVRAWDPRLQNEPKFSGSVADAVYGQVVTIAPGSLLLNDTDGEIRALFGRYDSFYEKTVDVWFVVNGVTQKAFSAKVSGVRMQPKSVMLLLHDLFSPLRQPALYDTREAAYFLREAGSFPNLDAQHHGKPCRLIIGKQSRWKAKGHPDGGRVPDYEEMDEAVCTNFSTTVSSTTNREWGLCRTRTALQTPVGGTIATENDTTNEMIVSFTGTWSGKNLEIGDFCTISQAAKLQNYGRIIAKSEPTDSTAVITLRLLDANPSSPNYYTSAVTLTWRSAVAIAIFDESGNEYHPRPVHDFTITSTATAGGNVYHKITFLNGFESAFPGMPTLDPTKHRVYFRLRCQSTSELGHGEALKDMLEYAGVPVDSTSFSDADTDLDADVLFSIPQFDETDYAEYLKYAELVVGSTVGYLTSNEDGEAVYNLLEDPVAVTALTEHEFTRGSLNMEIEYADIETQVIAYNPHDYSTANESEAASSETAVDSAAEYLHGVTNVTRLRHVLADISGRIDTHLAVRAAPAVTYQFEVPTSLLTATIGDDATLETDQVLGGETSENMKIVSLEKSMDSVAVRAAVIRGT